VGLLRKLAQFAMNALKDCLWYSQKYGIRAFASFPHGPKRSLQVRFQIFFARSSDSTPKAQQSQGSNSVSHPLDRESATERNYANCRHDEMIRLDSAESQAFPNPPWDIRALNIPNNVSQEPSDLYQFFDMFPTNSWSARVCLIGFWFEHSGLVLRVEMGFREGPIDCLQPPVPRERSKEEEPFGAFLSIVRTAAAICIALASSFQSQLHCLR
jgi:hypothetical protein